MLNGLLDVCGADDAPHDMQCGLIDGASVLYTADPGAECAAAATAANRIVDEIAFTSAVDGAITCTLDGYLKQSGGDCDTTVALLNSALDKHLDGDFNTGCVISTPTTSPTTI